MHYTNVRARNPQSTSQRSGGFLGRGLSTSYNGLNSNSFTCQKINSSIFVPKPDPLKHEFASFASRHTISLPFLSLASPTTGSAQNSFIYPRTDSDNTRSLQLASSEVITPSPRVISTIPRTIYPSTAASRGISEMSNVTLRGSTVPSTVSSYSGASSQTTFKSLAVIVPKAKRMPKKKYKPVALKVRPVIGELPDKFRIIRNIVGDPLADLPILDPNPPDYKPCGRYTADRKAIFDKNNPGFLLEEERKLLHYFMMVHQDAFAWNDTERGHFREDFFPPIEIPVVPHTPWVQRNIPIPPGIYDEVCQLLQRKIDAGVFEPSNSSYRSRWFCVVKKDGKSLRIVQSLEPLNEVTIQHSGVPPFSEQLVEHFAARACGSMMDLYVGYDERALAKSSRDYTTFQTPYGAMRLTTLPMGWTNSVPIFHDDVTFILRPEIPQVTQPYIDDVPVRGPATRYVLPSGEEERIPQNPGIRRFVWEHFQDLNRICQRMKYSGGTFSGFKSFLCAPEITVLGHRCTSNGRLPDESRVIKVTNWEPCNDLSDVRAFVGTVGLCRMFIRNFASRAHHLIKLTRKEAVFEFGEDQLAAMDDLKNALVNSPALRPIDYTSGASVILSVDTSYIAVGFLLAQCDVDNPRLRYYAKFGSITLNEREARFSQPKLELYGLYRTLRALKLILLGLRNLVVEVDAAYIKGMLRNPDLAPSASINRWIVSILMFHFTLVHVPGTHHGPDGLSRRRPQPGDLPEPDDDFEDWVDQVNGFMHFINAPPSRSRKYNGVVCTPPVSCFIIEEADEPADAPNEDIGQPVVSMTYADVPRSEKALVADAKLGTVKHGTRH
jgi:hypothetical protein